jgi:hypothetical protein
MKTDHWSRLARRDCFALSTAALFLVGLAGTLAHAQDTPAEDPAAGEPLMLREFKELREAPYNGEMVPIDENPKQRLPVQNMLRAGNFGTDEEEKKNNEKIFNEFYRFRIAELTWLDNLPLLTKKRQDFKKRDLPTSGNAPDQTVHDRLNGMLLNALRSLASNETYHPAARLNCMLLIASLDQKEPDFQGKGAIPLPAALPVLKQFAEDEKMLDAVRIAALQGLGRHCEAAVVNPAADIKSDVRKNLVMPLLRDLVESKAGKTSPGAGKGTVGGRQWMRNQAAITIGVVADKWPEANDPATGLVLQQMIKDQEANLLSRCEAANSLGSMDKVVFNGNARAMAHSLGELAVDVCKKGPVPESAKVGNEYLTYSYLRVLHGLKNPEKPGRGLASAAPDAPTKSFIDDLSRRIDDMVQISNDAKLQDPTRIERLVSAGDRLQEWLKKTNTNLASGS